MGVNFDDAICARKRSFENARLARKAARGYRKRSNFKSDMVAYKCNVCDQWHLATKQKPQKLKQQRKRQEPWDT